MFIGRLGHIVLSSIFAYILKTNIWNLDLTKKIPRYLKHLNN